MITRHHKENNIFYMNLLFTNILYNFSFRYAHLLILYFNLNKFTNNRNINTLRYSDNKELILFTNITTSIYLLYFRRAIEPRNNHE